MAQTLTKLLVHIVFSTKDREPLITDAVAPELYLYLAGIGRNHESPVLAAGGVADHVHLLVSQSKNIAVATLLQHLKKDSSRWIKTKSASLKGFAWQEGYGAFTIGESQVPALTRYIENQSDHHRDASFQDEFRALLRKYRVGFDERYVWR
ncbi:MAG: IS200/IS605 family transposase [Phycisphaerales bacterium]